MICFSIKSNNNFKTVRKGVAYNNIIVELVPNCIANTQSIGIESIIVRMDLEFNEEALATQLSMGKCSIITTKPVNLDLLNQFKENIKEFFFLDQSFPFLVKTINSKEKRCAVRFSEYEDIKTAYNLRNKIKWVWVDYFNKFSLNKSMYLLIKFPSNISISLEPLWEAL